MAAKRYMWIVRSPEKNLVFFDYDKGSMSSDAAIKILDGYKGHLQCDGYGVYEVIAQKQANDIHLVGSSSNYRCSLL